MKNLLSNLTLNFARIRFTLEFKGQAPRLPKFYGHIIRGALGEHLKKAVCIVPDTDCNICLVKSNCAYPFIFDNKILSHPGLTPHLLTQPYVIEPEIINKKYLVFNIVLFGQGIFQLPYIVYAFTRIGGSGLGPIGSREQFFIKSVENVLPDDLELLFSAESSQLYLPQRNLTINNFLGVNEKNNLTIKFITPLRLQNRGKYMEECNFELLTDALIRRIIILESLFGKNENFNPDEFKNYIYNQEIKTEHQEWQWEETERFSKRQKVKMKLGGIIGNIEVSGNLTGLFPLLKIGEYLHIGKNCSFGLGRYQVAEKTNNQ